MRKQLLTIVLVLFSCIESFSQVRFENGYFIDETNKKIECLIKNVDWKSNPNEFEYKLLQNEESQKATIQTVKEFGINNFSKYIRAKVEIDRSSNQIDNLSSEREPHFQEEVLFLKVLIEGPASLFLYKKGDLTRFFFSTDASEIKQLVFKSYTTDIYKKIISQNNSYKQQLLLALKCNELGLKEFEFIKYDKNDLEGLFVKYNECSDPNYINTQPDQNKDLFNLSLRPGINFCSFEIQDLTSGKRYNSGNVVGIRFGMEAEFILPFNKNKWGIIIEPNFQYIKSELSNGKIRFAEFDYKTIELPIGIRHYFFLNEKSKLFTNISYVFGHTFNSTIDNLTMESRSRFALGIGYKYKDRYNLELRYHTNSKFLNYYRYWDSTYKNLEVILGISVF